MSGHVLRHTFATHAASTANGTKEPMPLRALKRQMNHKRESTTLRHIHATDAVNADLFKATVAGF